MYLARQRDSGRQCDEADGAKPTQRSRRGFQEARVLRTCTRISSRTSTRRPPPVSSTSSCSFATAATWSGCKAQETEGAVQSQALDWFVQMALALRTCSRRILHRDLKTANVFLTAAHCQAGRLACHAVVSHRGAARTFVGTPLPEPRALNNQPYGQPSMCGRSAVFHEIATLEHPHEGDDLPASRSSTRTPVGVVPAAQGMGEPVAGRPHAHQGSHAARDPRAGAQRGVVQRRMLAFAGGRGRAPAG